MCILAAQSLSHFNSGLYKRLCLSVHPLVCWSLCLSEWKTKSDTRLLQSRVGGQGLYLRSLNHLGRSSEAKDHQNPKKVKCDGRRDRWTYGPTNGRTDGPTDRLTDRQKKRVVESHSTQLKNSLDGVCGGWGVDGHLMPLSTCPQR